MPGNPRPGKSSVTNFKCQARTDSIPAALSDSAVRLPPAGCHSGTRGRGIGNLSNREAAEAGGWGDALHRRGRHFFLQLRLEPLAVCGSLPLESPPCHVSARVFGVVRKDSDSGNLEMVSVAPQAAAAAEGLVETGRSRPSF